MPSAPHSLTAAEFGRGVIARAVTTERIEQALAGLTAGALPGNTISAGFGGLARLTITGELGTPRVRPRLNSRPEETADEEAFAVTIPATLDLTVTLGGDSHIGTDVEIE